MCDNLIFYWMGNERRIHRFHFQTKDGTMWSFGRVSPNLNESPTLRRENNAHKDLLVKLTIDMTCFSVGKVKHYLTFSKNRLIRQVNLTGENNGLWTDITRPVKLRCKFIVFPVLDFAEENVDEKPEHVDISSDVVIKNIKDLSLDLQNILSTGHLSDVVLTNGSIEIKVHKVILAARSPVFQRMFSYSMKENEENRVVMTDIDDIVLNELVSFMYTGIAADMCFSLACDVLSVADRYAVDGLKTVCCQLLSNKISLETAIDLVILADIYNEKVLKMKAMLFILSNFAKVKISEEWDCLTKKYPMLYTEILAFLVDQLTSKTLSDTEFIRTTENQNLELSLNET